MASPASDGAVPCKPSFAKIAASGVKSHNTQQNPTNTPNSLQQQALPSPPQDGSYNVTSPSAHVQYPNSSKPMKLVHLPTRDTKEMETGISSGPQVHVDAADATSPPTKAPPAPEGRLMPSASDDAGTQISSSDGDGKPPSLDGKSVASGTTFALDEKESLRPDDSASVAAAAEDEDAFGTSASGIPSSRFGSEDGTRAFRDQLHEIQEMGPSRQQPRSGAPGNALQGVLYVPPQGPGIGPVPSSSRPTTSASEKVNGMPDPKLLEALENPRDRIWVLKLEQDVIDFVKDPKETSLNLPQCNSFYRMLAHKIADYYLLGHSVDEVSSAVRLYRSSSCRIPPPLTGVVTPSTAASTPPPAGPQMKILRRGIDPGPAIANGSNMPSSANSDNGDSGDDKKKPVSREEREARYEAARLRIMGSAKPTESPETSKEKDDSRSSSAAGKKAKRKQRDHSDDGFEARSAYSSYYAGPYSANAYQHSGLTYQNLPSTQPGAQPPQFAGPDMSAFQQYNGSAPSMQWAGPPSQGQDASQSWYQGQPQGYDLSRHFGNAMSFQGTGMPDQHNQSAQPQYNQSHTQQPYGMPNSWQPQGYNNNQTPQTGYGAMQAYPSANPPSAQQMQYPQQQYPFGQLPSQTMGRPPNALEHPLPGSYKSPHFNPQSQSFVPTQASSPAFHPSMPQRAPTNPNQPTGYGMSYPLEHQMSTQSQNSSYGPAHLPMNNTQGAARMPSQPLTHPLPEPVFPRQPSPNVPLPPKPIGGFQQQNQQPTDNAKNWSNNHSASQPQSSIAKWGTPASLPAKPPPSTEPFDPQRFAQAQRTPGFNTTVTGRMPSGGLQGFGGVSPMAGQAVVNGSNSPGGKRM